MTKRTDPPDADEPEEFTSTDPSKPLRHVRRERAVQLYMGGATKMASYEGAGFSSSTGGTYKLFASPDVAARVSYLQADEADKAAEERAHLRMASGFTKLKAMTQFELARVLAMKTNRPAAAVSAIIGMAKLEGLIRDVLPVTPLSLGDMSVEQLEQYLADLSAAERTVGDTIAKLEFSRGGDSSASGDVGDTKPRPN